MQVGSAPGVPLAPELEPFLSAARPIGDGGSQPTPALALSLPGFLPGSGMHETDLQAGRDMPLAANPFVSMPGAVLAHASEQLGEQREQTIRTPLAANPFVSVTGDVLAHASKPLGDRMLPHLSFSLRREVMHAFICYRVATEGELPPDSLQILPCCTLRPRALTGALLIPVSLRARGTVSYTVARPALVAQGPRVMGSPSESPRKSNPCRRTATC
ncbi:hypothetical protein T484DRAFT_3623620 [Baffinella frigidus]|nr:hypothetical protein T484DRAFT_3623620 [Cryptophyta sp. CCMP2293]